MSIKVTNWVWCNSQSRNGARLVMLALADRADDSGCAWPSIEDICERTLLSPRAVQKGISKLVEIGELEVEEGGGRRVRNRYRIVPKPRTSDGVTHEKPGHDDGVTSSKPRTSDGVSPEETPHFEAETPHFATETPQIVRENPVKSAGEPPLEPSTEPSGNHHYDTRANEDRLPVKVGGWGGSEPEWLTHLQDAMSAAGINVPWKFYGDDRIRLQNDVQRLGIPLMVEQAVKAVQSATKPPFSSRWFYDGWHHMRTPVAIGDRPNGVSNVVALASGQPLPGTDTNLAGWAAVAASFDSEDSA